MSKDDMPKPPRVEVRGPSLHLDPIYHMKGYSWGSFVREVVSSTLGAAIAIYVMAQMGVI